MTYKREVKKMKLGYARVSTKEQNEARQIELLLNAGIEREYIYIDKKSGKNTDRENYRKMLDFARKGDTIIVESISRIARNTKDLLNIIDYFEKNGISFISLKESFDTTTPNGKFVITMFGALAELERDLILERQREGIEIAKKEGKFKGKKKTEIDMDLFIKTVKEWRNGKITAVKCMEIVNLKPNTFYRRVKEYNL